MFKRYHASVKKACATFFGAAFLWGLILLTSSSFGTPQNTHNILIGSAIFLGGIAFLEMVTACSYIEIGSETVTYLQFDLDWKRTAPIKNIIGIGVPSRNWLVPVMYIWYDDPRNAGVDKYINIKQAVFREDVLAEVALHLKSVNPKIKIDEKMQRLIEKNRRT